MTNSIEAVAIATDTRSGTAYAYTYNKANRLKTVTVAGNLLATYTYNAREQLISRVITNSGTLNGTTHFIHDLSGNVIAELNATGATVKEYIYLPETEIAPTRQSRTTVDMPVAVVTAVNTATPATFMVHVDHLNRPIRMTDGAKATVWDAVWTPWGSAYSITGAQTLDARFPGQWFQTEAGLHYNWHRHYDPSLGRYTQPDPLGFVDGPSVYAYAGNSPFLALDPLGLDSTFYTNRTGGRGLTDGPTNGNWGGKCWSGGAFSCGRKPPQTLLPPTDSGDACYKRHDDCFDHCSHSLIQSECIRVCNQWLTKQLRDLPKNSKNWSRPPQNGTESDSESYRDWAIWYFHE